MVSPSPSSVFVSGDGGDLELGVKLFVVAVCFCFGRAGERVSFGVAVAVVVVCFVSGGRGSESALVSSSPSSVFVSGDGGDLELGVKLFVAVVCFCFGGTGERVSFGVAVAVVCFCFGGRRRFGVGCETVRRRRLFLFWAGGGASQLWCRRRRRLFLFRGDGGESASGVRSNGLCPQRVLAAGGLVPVGFKHSWLSTSHYLLAKHKLCDGDSLRVRARGRSCARAPARRRERG